MQSFFTQAQVFEGKVLVYCLEYEQREDQIILKGKQPTGQYDWIPWDSAAEAHLYARELLRVRHRVLLADLARLQTFLDVVERRPKAIDEAEALFREHSLKLAQKTLEEMKNRLRRVAEDVRVAETGEVLVLEEVGGFTP